jgi:TPR repeat protein
MKNRFRQTTVIIIYLTVFSLLKSSAGGLQGLLDSANEGYAEAQFYLGSIYEDGLDDVPKNMQEAAKWYRKAADQNHAEAQYRYAYLLENGTGVKKNLAEAAKWFQKAAERGFVSAQIAIARAYHEGRGVPKDQVKAVNWLEQAAENGSANGQLLLGAMYRVGEGVTKNPKEAFYWFKRSGMQGFAAGQALTAMCYKDGSGVVKNEFEALAWFNLAAAQDDEHAIRERATLEKRLGYNLSTAAQQRSRELEKQIRKEPRKKSTQPSKNDKQGSDKEIKATGTGVFITDDGYIITAAHVVSDANSVNIVTETSTKEAVVKRVDKESDVALLKCEGTFVSSPIRPSHDVKLGQSVFTIGFPNIGFQGVSPKMTRGEISSLSGFKDNPKHWQISVPLQPGNSGGPLFDNAGNVIGVILSKLDALKVAQKTGDLPQNVNYAAKSASFMPMLREIEAKLSPERTSFWGTKKIETVVEEIQRAVVLILVY